MSSSLSSSAVCAVLPWILFAPAFAGETVSIQTVLHALDQAEARRESQLPGYTVTEHYTLAVSRFSLSAEMTVETVYRREQGKSFHVISRSGSPMLQSRVFDRLLSEEAEMSRGETRRGLLVNSANYAVRLGGEATLEGTECYVLELTPRTKSTYLLQGRAWVDKEDGSLIRIEGVPGASPSFLSGRPRITREYEKLGEFWLARRSHSVTDTFLSGKSELVIDYRDYRILSDYAPRP